MFNSKKEISILVGNRVRSLRIASGKSMVNLAYESEMEYMQLSRIELGQINTSVYQLLKISKALNVELKDLFLFNENTESE
ncbi:MAG: Helix-turn-helix domain [Bacteroidota bacterium]|jgi:transcriptional regulator with XRE-family HTH domain